MKLLATLTILLTSTLCFAQENNLELDTMYFKGKYSGKNLFVKNPFNGETNKGFSIQSVELDNEVTKIDYASAIEIKLDKADREVGDDVKIAIIHFSGYVPEVLNLEVIDEK